MEELDVRRDGLAALKRLHQSQRRCASRSDKYAVAGLDGVDGRLGRHEPVGDPLERRPKVIHPRLFITMENWSPHAAC
jgi:hypothetical protein